jgi:hypothetical protein
MQYKFAVTPKYLVTHNAFDVLDVSAHASARDIVGIPVSGSRRSTLGSLLAAYVRVRLQATKLEKDKTGEQAS